MDAILSDRGAAGSDRRRPARGARSPAGEGLRRHAAADSSTRCCGPAAPQPQVTFDFWEQFDAAEELEELRLYRPAIYQALPSRKRNVEEKRR